MSSHSLKKKILLSHMAVIGVLSMLIVITGSYFIKKDIIDKAQVKIKHDLNMAREVYKQETYNIKNTVRLTANRLLLKNGVSADNSELIRDELEKTRQSESLDFLTLTDANGHVVVRPQNPELITDDQSSDRLIRIVMDDQKTVSSTDIMPCEILQQENPLLQDKVYIEVIPTPRAKPVNNTHQTSAMCIKVAAPVFGDDNNLIGVLYGGNILNRNYDIVDKVQRIVFQGEKYNGKDLGNVTIFQKDMRISTNVKDINGNRAIGTRVSEDVYDQVLLKGIPWTDSAFVVNDWYKTAYEPIRNIDGEIIGMLYVGTLERPFVDIARNITVVFLLIIVVVTLLAMILSAILASHVSRPLVSLIKTTAKLSDGYLGERVDTKTSVTELNSLATSFNEMSAKLRERQENLKTLNKNYVDLIGFVAHELRGILASAVMNAYAIKDGFLGLINFKQQRAIDSVTRNLDYLTAVVGKFLNLGRIEKGELDIHKSPINIREDVFGVSIPALFPLAKRKGINIDNQIHNDITIDADADLMQIVANNLITNAIKYGDENGNIIVKDHQVNGFIEIEVYNDSIPIRNEQKDRLFTRFSRLDNEWTKKEKGTGLGLYITKQIVEKHGGKIRVEPRAKGNSFIFNLSRS